MNGQIQKLCAYSGCAFVVLFMIAFLVVGDLVPPIPPSWSAAQVAQFFATHSLQLKAAMAISMIATPLGFPWSAVIAIHTSRIEGRFPVLSVTQLLCSIWSFGGLFGAVVPFVAAVFRPDRPAEIIYMLDDQGWIWTVMIGSAAVMQGFAIGLAMLSDSSAFPVFPRWLGYFNCWVGILLIPGCMVPFFTTGPFAWNGLFAFWVPLTMFSVWIFVDCWAILRVIDAEQVEARPTQTTVSA